VPVDASVGSAVGFLRAPVSFEVVRSLLLRDDAFDAASVDEMLRWMQGEAEKIVAAGALGAQLQLRRFVEMRYLGQGHELSVPLPAGRLNAAHARKLRADYEARYERQFGLRIPDVPVEFLTWSVNISTVAVDPVVSKSRGKGTKAVSSGKRKVFDPLSGKLEAVAAFWRGDLSPGTQLTGPALIVEPQTTTLVPRGWKCSVAGAGHLMLVNDR
jgi:N-methylhydantoinase A